MHSFQRADDLHSIELTTYYIPGGTHFLPLSYGFSTVRYFSVQRVPPAVSVLRSSDSVTPPRLCADWLTLSPDTDVIIHFSASGRLVFFHWSAMGQRLVQTRQNVSCLGSFRHHVSWDHFLSAIPDMTTWLS